MPSVSKQQQKFFGVVKAMQKGDTPKKGKAGKAAKSMSKDDVDDFASTKHKGKPEKVKREMKVKNLIKKMVREELAKMNEGKLNERLHVVDERYVGKYIIWVLQDGNKIRTAVLGKKGFDNFSSNDPDDLKKLWNLTKKFKGKPIPDIATEGTCGYGENGELGEEPAGPHLIKKKLKEKQSAAVQRMAKQGMWVVTDGGRETIKVVKNERAAKMLVKKLKKSGKYNSPEAKAIKLEGKLTEAKETIFDVAARVMKDKQAYGYNTKKGLVTVDMQTANLLTKVFKKVNPKMKKILSDIGYKSPTQLMNTLWAVVK